MTARSGRNWSWKIGLFSFVAGCNAIADSGNYAFAQIVPDATLGAERSIVTPNAGNVDAISGGATRGANLFHSFEQFSVLTGREAFFNNAASIQNIISRVTGGEVSNIDGLLRANASANLFLLNPNGITFGPNASLNIGGSFVGSTASSLNFADGTEFSATAPQTTPLLTISVPLGLQFGANPGSIVNQSQAQSLSGEINYAGEPVGLQVPPGKTLALVGGNVFLEGGNLTAAGGRIELGSVAGNGNVSLSQSGSSWVLGYDLVNTFREIKLEDGAFVDASGESGGDIQIQGDQLQVKRAYIFAVTLGTEAGGDVLLHTTEAITLSGSSSLIADTEGSGDAGNLEIETGQLIVQDGAQVGAGTFGEGQGGTLTVTASESVELLGTGMSADRRYPSGLFTDTFGAGDAGTLKIQTGKLIVRDGAEVASDTFGEGQGGTLIVTASDSVELMGRSGLFTDTFGAGSAGDLQLTTRRLVVQDGAQISAGTLGEGQGGSLTVRAEDSVELFGIEADTQSPSVLFAATQGAGAAGILRIETEQLLVRDGARVTVSSTGSGNAGNLEVAARFIRLDNQALLSSDTKAGQGNILLRSEDLVLRRSSNITTSATGTATGGNITIDTGVLAALEDSDIRANAQDGPGGRVIIDAQGIFGTQFRDRPTPESDITASSDLGSEFRGIVEINNPDVDPSQGLVELPAELADASDQIASGGCAVGQNKFTIAGRGGLPPNPREPLNGEAVLTNWATLSGALEREQGAGSRETNSTNSTNTPTQIVEATGWVVNDKGEVVLTAAAHTPTLDIPWLPESGCHASKPSL